MDLPKHVGTVAVGRTENIVESCLPSAPLPTRERNKDPCHIPIMHTHTPSRLTRSLKKQKRDQEPQDARHRRAAHTAWAISLRAAEVLSARGGAKSGRAPANLLPSSSRLPSSPANESRCPIPSPHIPKKNRPPSPPRRANASAHPAAKQGAFPSRVARSPS